MARRDNRKGKTPEETEATLRSLRGREMAYQRLAKHGGEAIGRKLHAAFEARFADAADPQAALRAHMLDLSLRSAKARAARKRRGEPLPPRPILPCPWCCVESRQDFPPGISSQVCARHLDELRDALVVNLREQRTQERTRPC